MSACCVCTLQSVSCQILLEPTSTEFQLSVCCSLHPLSATKVAGQAYFDANKDIKVHVSSPVYMFVTILGYLRPPGHVNT